MLDRCEPRHHVGVNHSSNDPETQPLAPAQPMGESDPYWPRRKLSIGDYLSVLVNVPNAILILLSHVMCTSWWLRYYAQWHCCVPSKKYRQNPSDKCVAIIGAGWTGVQLAARLCELGMLVMLLEEEDDFGGTWHPNKRYAGLHIHTPAWAAEFPHYPFAGGERTRRDQNASGSAMHEYICSFAKRHKLRQLTRFGCKAVRVAHDSATRQATVTVEQQSETHELGPFDMVIFTGFSSVRQKPTLPGEAQFVAAGGISMHSGEMRADTIHALANDARRVVVVGGSKSSCDQVDSLSQAGIAEDGRVLWLYRKPCVLRAPPAAHHPTPLVIYPSCRVPPAAACNVLSCPSCLGDLLSSNLPTSLRPAVINSLRQRSSLGNATGGDSCAVHSCN